jgi:hypothetical protein
MLQAMNAIMYPDDYLVDDGEEEQQKKKDGKSDK